MNDVQATYSQIHGRPPQDRELFLHDGNLSIYRGQFPAGRWESLGAIEEDAPDVGRLDFELQDGIIASGAPPFVIRLLLRAFYRIPEKEAAELTSCIYSIFRECGWSGPAETEDQKLSGSVTVVDAHGEVVQEVDDLRPVYAQLQDPAFNGWLSMTEAEGPEAPQRTIFVNVGGANRLVLERRPRT